MKNCEFLISDGGSNQEESSYLGIPCLLLRYKTERQEGINNNVILSKFNKPIIKDFIINYKKHKKINKNKRSPTKKIIENISKLK